MSLLFHNPRSKPLAASAESIGTVSVTGSPIKLQTSIKNLGVYFYSISNVLWQAGVWNMQGLFISIFVRCVTFGLLLQLLRLDFCNSLLAGTSVSNLIAFSLSRILLLEWSHNNVGSATSHLFFLICIGFRFATESVLKLLRLLSGCCNLSSHPTLHLSSHDYVPTRALRSSSSLSICASPRKTTMATSKSFSYVASN